MNRIVTLAAAIGGSIALATAAQAFPATPALPGTTSPVHKVSDGGGDCGWFAISVCSRGRGGARRAANRFGGRVIDTGDVDGFRPGWYCAVKGPRSKGSANRARRNMRDDGARSAYIKRGCL